MRKDNEILYLQSPRNLDQLIDEFMKNIVFNFKVPSEILLKPFK